jgi:hypothetical protein
MRRGEGREEDMGLKIEGKVEGRKLMQEFHMN